MLQGSNCLSNIFVKEGELGYLVTDIIEMPNAKRKVYLDYELAFVLYKNELRKYDIKLGGSVSEELVQQINHQVLFKRGLVRCMELLKRKDYSKYELEQKLRNSLYCEDIIEQVMHYIEQLGYINDFEYAIRFIQIRMGKFSKKEMIAKLYSRGIEKNTIAEAMNKAFEDQNSSEVNAIITLIQKKAPSSVKKEISYDDKLIAYLYRKGFEYDDIKLALNEWNSNKIDTNL